MQLEAVTNINHGGRLLWPKDRFNCEDHQADSLIKCGAAVRVTRPDYGKNKPKKNK